MNFTICRGVSTLQYTGHSQSGKKKTFVRSIAQIAMIQIKSPVEEKLELHAIKKYRLSSFYAHIVVLKIKDLWVEPIEEGYRQKRFKVRRCCLCDRID